MVRVWRAAIGCFLIAGITGVLFRFGFLFGLPFGLEAGGVRHAHSHLMYFGWAAPAIMALMMAKLNRAKNGRSPFAGVVGAMAVALGLSVYPAFLVAGYEPIPMFGVTIPAASILSGLNMFVWYMFAGWYLAATRGIHRTGAIKLWDGALAFLMLSTAGAWGRFFLEVLNIDAPIVAEVAVHFFLGAFTEGWLVLAVLGLLWWNEESETARQGAMGRAEGGDRVWASRLVWLGMPFAALHGSQVEGLPAAWGVLTGIGGLLVAGGLGWYAWRLGRAAWADNRREWLPVLGFLAVKIIMQVGMTFPAVVVWGQQMGLRIIYLHILALGMVSTGLMAAAREEWGRAAAPFPWHFGGAVLGLVVGMIALTPFWPLETRISGRLAVAAWTSLLPLLLVALGGIRAVGYPSEERPSAVE